jgi:hypothetical protein
MTATTDKTTGKDSAQPPSGMARVRESEAWRTASIMHDAAFEAERVCNEIYQAVTKAYEPRSGETSAAEVAACYDIAVKAGEARDLLQAAITYLSTLTKQPGYRDDPW